MAARLGENAFLLRLERFLASGGRCEPGDVRRHGAAGPAGGDAAQGVRYEWITIAFLAGAITLVGLVAGNSQSMKVAWAEDMLSLAPPIAFLIAGRIIRKPPTAKRPYGYHRSVGWAICRRHRPDHHGTLLIIDSAVGLVTAEHPSIGSVQLFGQVFWLGWLMMGAMVGHRGAAGAARRSR
jgi:hypothetical protein